MTKVRGVVAGRSPPLGWRQACDHPFTSWKSFAALPPERQALRSCDAGRYRWPLDYGLSAVVTFVVVRGDGKLID